MQPVQTTSQKLLGLDAFPIMGWCSVPEEFTRPEVFAAIRDCGINVFMTVGAGGGATGPTGDASPIFRQLELAAEYGLKAIVCDKRFNPALPGEGDWKPRVDAAVAEYTDHPAVGGYYVFDEPTFGEFQGRARVDEVAVMMEYLLSVAPDKVAYVNGLGFGRRGLDSFDEYIDQYTAQIRPQFISTDCYPITTMPPQELWSPMHDDDCGIVYEELGSYHRACFWDSWETIKRTSQTHGVPLWGFVMAVPHTHSIWFYGPVTEGTLRLEAFTALAYGSEVVQYFSLTTHVANENYEHAILDPDGKPSIRYELFRKVNRDLQILGRLTGGMTVGNVYYTGEAPEGCRKFHSGRWAGDSSHKPLARVEGDPVILSFMKDPDGQRYLLVVNRSPERRGRTRLTLDAGWNMQEIIKHDGALCATQSNTRLINFEAGDARLLKLSSPEEENAGRLHEVN